MKPSISILFLGSFVCASLAGISLAEGSKTETFDFDWKFARFGPMPDGSTLPEPGRNDLSQAIKSDSSEQANIPSYAIDGNRDTRWCANDMKPGHYLIVDFGRTVTPASATILWEKENNHQFKIEGSLDGGKWFDIVDKTRENNVTESDSVTIGKPVNMFRITVNGTGPGNWASIREMTFTDKQGDVIPPVKTNGDDSQKPQSPGFNDSSWRSLNLPHDWGIEGPFRMDLPNETGKLPWAGIGWYRKNVLIPASAEGKRFYLDFDGVMARPEIYVNGKLAGEWKYGYSSFRVDITPYIKWGKENTVAVRVDNPPNSSRWYPGGGIYRHVWLTESNPVHIDNWGVYVRTPSVSRESATVDVDTSVVNNSAKKAVPVVTEEILFNGKPVASTKTKGKAIAPGKKGKVASQLTIKEPALWDIGSPNLYTLRSTVTIDGKTVDVKTTDFGVRTVEWKPDGFFLNGRKVKLNGVCQHHDLGPLGSAVHRKGYERQVKLLKEMGVNAIRTSHNPPAPELLDICDREGILVIDELFDMWKTGKKGQDYHQYFDEWHERDLVNLCHRDRNHPCVIAWSSGNEIPEQNQKQKGHAISQRLTDLFHKEDPTRKVTVGCNNLGAAYNGFADTVDIFGFNYAQRGTGNYRNFSKKRPEQPFLGTETSSCVSSRGSYFFPSKEDFWNKGKGGYDFQVSSYDLYAPGWAGRPDLEFAMQDGSKAVAGEFVWTGFDYIGEPTPYNGDKTNALNFHTPEERARAIAELEKLGNRAPSRSSYFGILDLCGFKKDRFYIYQAQWMPDKPMAHILPHWNWPERKGMVTPVHVYTSGDEAELFLNGKSLGKRAKGTGEKDSYRLVWDDVVYEPGELKVAVTKNGQPWAQDSVKTTGEAASLKLAVEHPSIKGDGRDLSYVTVTIHDKEGLLVPRSDNGITFTADGAAEIVGICNGDATDFTTMTVTDRNAPVTIKAFNGMAQVILRSKRGATGKTVLKAESPSLNGQQTEITVTPATPEEIKTAR